MTENYSKEEMNEAAMVSATADGLTIEGPNRKVGRLLACPDMLSYCLGEVERLEKELARYAMSAGSADQYRAEALACRRELGFAADSDEVSPSDLIAAIRKERAEQKLYAWQPKGHGEYSFFVMAETEEEAKQAVEKKIEEEKEEQRKHLGSDYFCQGWGTEYYELKVLEAGEVVFNPND